MNATTTVITATSEHRAAVVRALSSAFYEDPVFRWIYPDDARRQAVLPGVFELFTDAIGRHGATLVTADGGGAALWIPPGEGLADDEEAFVEAALALSPPDTERMLACMTVLGETHPHEPCWYLNLVGVVADRQGQGIGSDLMRAGLERAERDGIPAYLEATSPENRRLYERHGFEATADLELPGGPTLWAMWRR